MKSPKIVSYFEVSIEIYSLTENLPREETKIHSKDFAIKTTISYLINILMSQNLLLIFHFFISLSLSLFLLNNNYITDIARKTTQSS